MKLNRLVIPAIAALTILLAGCSAAVDKSYAMAVNESNKVVLPEYQTYYRADPNLSDEDKERRDRLVDSIYFRDEAALED